MTGIVLIYLQARLMMYWKVRLEVYLSLGNKINNQMKIHILMKINHGSAAVINQEN